VSLPERITHVSDGLHLGSGIKDGVRVPVTLLDSDRVTHLNIIGRTGTGKSTLMHHLIHQDIARGGGVAVIDPHGSLIRDVLRLSIPPEREEDVVLIDLANSEYPPPLNPLRATRTYAATARVMSVIERLFQGFDGAPRMVNYLRSALLLLQADPDATMRDLSRVFLDDTYREDLLERIDNPELEDFWDMQYNQTSPQMRAQIAEPVLARVRPFFANPYLYPMLCHPDAFDFKRLIDEQRIILISLDVSEEILHRQERDLLGSLLVTQLQIAAMRERQGSHVFLYIDEVQRFVTTSLSDVLSEARKYDVVLTTANQYLGQLTGKTLEAVMGNVGTTIVFACSPEDASALGQYMKPEFAANKLVTLDRFAAAVKLQVAGQTQPAFSLLTDPPPPYPDDSQAREERIRAKTREQHTPKHRDTVMSWLKTRYPRRPTNRGPQPGSEQDTFYE
jgi:hypothetical protein